MHKIVKKFLAVGLILSMTFSMAACGKSEQKKESAKMSYGEVWSAPSTVKVKRDELDYANKGGLELSYQAVRNEYESHQLIISAEKDVTHFELKTADLKYGSEVLDDENVTVYVEKYIQYNDHYGSGYMPDALLPMKTADKYEENTIAAGNNGALWVTVYVPKETKPGKYEGTFELMLDGKSGKKILEVPISVEVYDYELADATTARTLFSWRYDRVAAGELDGSIDMMTYYYDFFQDYRISLEALPLETLSGEEFAANVLKYYEQLTTYTFLNTVGEKSGNLTNAEEKVHEQILAVAAECTKERNLFDKAMMYFIDEPRFDQDSWRANVVTRLRKLQEMLQNCVDDIAADTTGKYAEFKKIDNWQKSILNITNVIPITTASIDWLLANAETETGKELLSVLNCFCPGFTNYEINKEKLALLQEEYGIRMWWYGCVGPKAPSGTYHIGDQNLLSARSISWIQKQYNIEGNLYWDAAAYTDEAGEYYNEYLNIYEYPYRDTVKDFPAGDGFLAYPGEPYGIYGPIPSMRLMSIRDGMEEYDILNAIEQKYVELKVSFGEDFSYANEMNRFYRPLGDNAHNLYFDYANGLDFTTVRKNLLQLATGLTTGCGFAVGKVEIDNADATITYYVEEGATASIDGKVQQPIAGLKYTYSLNVEDDGYVEIDVKNAEGNTTIYRRFVGTPIYKLNTLSEQAVLDGIKVSDGSKATLVSNETYSTDGISVCAQIRGVLTGNDLIDADFVPKLSVATSIFGDTQPADVSAIYVDVYNPGDKFNVKVRLYSGTSYYEFGEYQIESGKTTLELEIKPDKFAKLDTADSLVFEFVNEVDGKAQSYDFYLDNMIGEK